VTNQPPPIIAPLDDKVPVKDRVYINTPAWRLFLQGLQATVNTVLGSYVASFNGRVGTVTPQSGDYSVGQVTNAVEEAPLDGRLYVRRNGAWEVLIIT